MASNKSSDKKIEAIPSKTVIIDASDATMGRLASFAAKQALLGREVIIVNCKYAIITGNHNPTIERYHTMRARGGSSMRGPNYPKLPYMIVKRSVRGMLPDHRHGRGKDAFKRVICYNDTPKKYENVSKIKTSKEKKARKLSILELSRRI